MSYLVRRAVGSPADGDIDHSVDPVPLVTLNLKRSFWFGRAKV